MLDGVAIISSYISYVYNVWCICNIWVCVLCWVRGLRGDCMCIEHDGMRMCVCMQFMALTHRTALSAPHRYCSRFTVWIAECRAIPTLADIGYVQIGLLTLVAFRAFCLHFFCCFSVLNYGDDLLQRKNASLILILLLGKIFSIGKKYIHKDLNGNNDVLNRKYSNPLLTPCYALLFVI